MGGVFIQEAYRADLIRRSVNCEKVGEVAQDGNVSDLVLRQVDMLQVVVCLQVRNALCVLEVLNWLLQNWFLSTRQVQHRESI